MMTVRKILMSKFRMPNSFDKWFVALAVAAVFSMACDSLPKETASSAAGNNRTLLLAANQKAMKEALDVPVAGIDGKTIKIGDLKGKVVVLDIWASWCPPCRKQVPELVKLDQRYRDQGLAVLGLTIEEKSDQKKIEAFMKDFQIDYTVAYSNHWISEAFFKGSEDESGQPPIPQVFVISRDGRVVEHLFAYDPPENLENVVKRELAQNRQ
jgi:thiol-disulfide isomerase/thioredoxin